MKNLKFRETNEFDNLPKNITNKTDKFVLALLKSGFIRDSDRNFAVEPIRDFPLGYSLANLLGLNKITYLLDTRLQNQNNLGIGLVAPITTINDLSPINNISNGSMDLIFLSIKPNIPYLYLSKDINRAVEKLSEEGRLGLIGRKRGPIRKVIRENDIEKSLLVDKKLFVSQGNKGISDTLEERLTYSTVVAGFDLFFETYKGVFSYAHLDEGTRNLLEITPRYSLNAESTILDLCCGYGPIGIFLAKAFRSKVDLTDIDEIAIELTKTNVSLNLVDDKVRVFSGNSVEALNSRKYDFVFSNLPGHVGTRKLNELVHGAYSVLNKHGRFISVNPALVPVEESFEKYFRRYKEISNNGVHKIIEVIK